MGGGGGSGPIYRRVNCVRHLQLQPPYLFFILTRCVVLEKETFKSAMYFYLFWLFEKKMNRSPFPVDAIFALSLVKLFRVVLEKKILYGVESETKIITTDDRQVFIKEILFQHSLMYTSHHL